MHRASARACEPLGWSGAETVRLGRVDPADLPEPTGTETVVVRGVRLSAAAVAPHARAGAPGAAAALAGPRRQPPARAQGHHGEDP
jgi:hypothetical protein